MGIDHKNPLDLGIVEHGLILWSAAHSPAPAPCHPWGRP